MKTEEATEKLGHAWQYGMTDDLPERAAIALYDVRAWSRAWNWKMANASMTSAYAALGAIAPKVAINAIHTGTHPVQIAAAALARTQFA